MFINITECVMGQDYYFLNRDGWDGDWKVEKKRMIEDGIREDGRSNVGFCSEEGDPSLDTDVRYIFARNYDKDLKNKELPIPSRRDAEQKCNDLNKRANKKELRQLEEQMEAAEAVFVKAKLEYNDATHNNTTP